MSSGDADMPDTDGGPDWWLLTVSEDEDGTRIDRFLRRSVKRAATGAGGKDAAVRADPA